MSRRPLERAGVRHESQVRVFTFNELRQTPLLDYRRRGIEVHHGRYRVRVGIMFPVPGPFKAVRVWFWWHDYTVDPLSLKEGIVYGIRVSRLACAVWVDARDSRYSL